MIKRRPTEKPCKDCREWRGCAGKEWFSMGEIYYCPNQVRWLIAAFLRVWADEIILMRDTWPREDKETGYTDAPLTQHAINSHASYESTLQVVAEVHYRLDNCGRDGRELVLMIETEADLSDGARNALKYCSGWWRKSKYQDWLRNREWRKMQRQALHTI